MYLRETVISGDIDYQACHIASYFNKLICHKIKTDSIWKVILFLSYRSMPDSCYNSFLDGLGVLTINALFDFNQYNFLGSAVDKSKMITDVFEDRLITAFKEYGVEAEGTTAAKNAFKEIREHNYIYKGAYNQSLISPNHTYKVGFYFTWKLGRIEIYIRVRKPYAKRDLCNSYLATIRSDWNSVKSYIESIAWTSEDEFVARMYDLSGRMKVFNILECKVHNYN